MITMILHWAVVAVLLFVFLCHARTMDKDHPPSDKLRWAALMLCSVASLPQFLVGSWIMGVGVLVFAVIPPTRHDCCWPADLHHDHLQQVWGRGRE